MGPNEGGFDRVVRFIAAIALLGLGYRNRDTLAGTLAFVSGSDILATPVIRRCPLNALLGVDTSSGS